MEEEVLTINFKELFKVLWKEKWWIIGITGLFMAMGIAYILLAKKEYVSTGKILPEIQTKGGNLSQFSGLAALAGVDLNSAMSAGDAIRPDLYPDIVTSTPFYLDLFKQEIHTKENQKMNFEEYYHQYIEEGKEPDEKLLKKYPVKEEGLILINRLNEIRLKDLRERITSTIDKKSGIISINVKMQDPVVAADVARFAMNYLVNYVTDYRIEKLKQDVDYLGDQVGASRTKYYSDQSRKASYADQYQLGTLKSQASDIQRERIESEYRMSSTFYNELLKKYEEAKFRLHQETPVFQVLEPPVIPVEESSPKKLLTVLFASFLGIGASLGFVVMYKKNYTKFID